LTFTLILNVVSRISAHSVLNKLSVELDVNTEIYPMEKGEFYKMVIASSVSADGSENFDVIRYENEGAGAGAAAGGAESLFE
jgi:hypothetical protein